MKRVLFGALLTLLSYSAAFAEIEKFIQIGEGNLTSGFSSEIYAAARLGSERRGRGRVLGLPAYVPKGQTFHHAPAVIYIRVSYNENKRDRSFNVVSQERWRNLRSKDTQVWKIPGEKRANGQPDFMVYRVHNPSHPQQAYEMLAYGVDKDKDGNDYFVMISITAMTQKAIAEAEATYPRGTSRALKMARRKPPQVKLERFVKLVGEKHVVRQATDMNPVVAASGWMLRQGCDGAEAREYSRSLSNP